MKVVPARLHAAAVWLGRVAVNLLKCALVVAEAIVVRGDRKRKR